MQHVCRVLPRPISLSLFGSLAKNRGKPSSTDSPSPDEVVADGFMQMDLRQAKHETAQTGEDPYPQGLPLAECGLLRRETSSAMRRLWLRRSAEERQRWGEAAAKCQKGQKRYRDGFHLFSASLRGRRSFHEQRDIRPLRTLPGPAELTTRFSLAGQRRWVRSSGQVAARTWPDERNHPGTGLECMPSPTPELWVVNVGFVPYPEAAEAARSIGHFSEEGEQLDARPQLAPPAPSTRPDRTIVG